jgi:hypothetical protein
MQRLHTVLLAAILGVLVVIGFQLTRIATALAPVGQAAAGISGAPHASNETRAERNRRLQREMSDGIEDARALLAAPTAGTITPPRDTRAPAR